MASQSTRRSWRKYTFEFLSIFVAVLSAFGLNNWNDNRKSRNSEHKILSEIRNSLNVDLQDFNNNIYGNQLSLRSNVLFTQLVAGAEIPQDSIALHYTLLYRDYIPIINKSAYESFKANNIKTITNDSLRLQIISLYDYYFTIIEALEYEVPEMQSYANYFEEMNAALAPYMSFDANGNLERIDSPRGLSSAKRNELLSYLWRIKKNRNFKLGRYRLIIEELKKVRAHITVELDE